MDVCSRSPRSELTMECVLAHKYEMAMHWVLRYFVRRKVLLHSN